MKWIFLYKKSIKYFRCSLKNGKRWTHISVHDGVPAYIRVLGYCQLVKGCTHMSDMF